MADVPAMPCPASGPDGRAVLVTRGYCDFCAAGSANAGGLIVAATPPASRCSSLPAARMILPGDDKAPWRAPTRCPQSCGSSRGNSRSSPVPPLLQTILPLQAPRISRCSFMLPSAKEIGPAIDCETGAGGGAGRIGRPPGTPVGRGQESDGFHATASSRHHGNPGNLS